MDSKIVAQRTLYKGTTNKIEIKQFYNLDGQKIDEGTEVKTFDTPQDFEIVEIIRRYEWDWQPNEFPWWMLKVNGETMSVGEIVEYKQLKTKLVIISCVGAG